MNRAEAEDFVYKSYLKASKFQEYSSKDSEKRRPDLTADILRERSVTPCVLVTGSKGKGSAANMISQVLQTRYKVGLMTSPHIADFCERFRINGEPISDEDFARYASRIKPEINRIDASIPENVCISPMGIQAVIGLEYFNDNHTDFNVIECGKGAKYDDMNNIIHQYAVINSIFLEHTRELGDTKEAIAEDKAHIITGDQKCAFIADQDGSVLDVFVRRAKKYNVPLKVYGKDFSAGNIRYSNNGMIFDVKIGEETFSDFSVPLLGEHQARNCALALAMCKEELKELDIASAKLKLSELDWPGRLEVISSDPLILLDACINSESCKNVISVLKHLNIERAVVIIGIPNDKDYAGVVKTMNPYAEEIILTKSQNPHYIFTEDQRINMKSEGIETSWTGSIEEAIDKALQKHMPTIILGTTSVVSEVKRYQTAYLKK